MRCGGNIDVFVEAAVFHGLSDQDASIAARDEVDVFAPDDMPQKIRAARNH